MNQNILAKNKSFNQIENDIDDEDHGILAKTGSFLSSLLFKVTNAINPFKSKSYVQNPYDLNSSKDPVNHLNYVDTINNNNNLFISSSFPNYHSKEQNLRNSNNSCPIYYGNNNFEENSDFMPNNLNNLKSNDEIGIENDYFSVEDLCNISPHLKKEIFKDIKKPNYIPNEELFQKAKFFVYENLVKKYRILKPKFSDKTFGESVILLAIQLTNKYNIDKHYDYLVNQKNVEYRLELNIPEIVKNYYNNKAKTLFYKDLIENSEQISEDVNYDLLNKFSDGLLNDKNKNDYSENRLICRTPKTKRNYITCLFENKFNYDYLCPNDKVKCQIYKECLLHKENELKNYARVIEVTNNMFKFICNENEKLRDAIKKKDEKIEEYTKQIVLDKIQNNEIKQKIKNYEKEIDKLKNSANNNLNDNNKNQNTFQQNSINKSKSQEQELIIKNINNNNNIFTLKKPFENNNDSISNQKTPTFNENPFNISNSSFFSKEKPSNDSNRDKNNKDSNLLLALKSESNEKNEDLIKDKYVEKENESGLKKETKLFNFIQSDDKKVNNEKEEKKEEITEFNINKNIDTNQTKSEIKFGFINKTNEEHKSNNNNIFNSDKVIFGFNNQEKKEQDKTEENKVIDKKEEKEKGKEKENDDKNSHEKESKLNKEIIDTNAITNKDEKKEENKEITKEETLNNPNNPFLSAINVKTNEAFTLNKTKEEKDKINNDISDRNSNRNTMDTSNNIIKLGESSKIENISEKNNNNFIFLTKPNKDETLKKSDNPFLSENKIESSFLKNQNENAMNISDSVNKSSNNISIDNLNNNINISALNTTNFTDKIVNNDNNNNLTNNSFLPATKYNSQDNSNNPFLSFNNNINNRVNSQNPFTTHFNSEIVNSINNNDNKQMNNASTNPFITTLTNSIMNHISNKNNSNNNISNTNNNNSSNNPFLTFNNNLNNNNNGSNNPFLQKIDEIPSSSSPVFGTNNLSNNNKQTDNSAPLFSFKMNTSEDKNKVNPFLTNYNGFNFGASNNSNNAFSLGVSIKKNDNSSFSMFDNNKSRKYMGFYN